MFCRSSTNRPHLSPNELINEIRSFPEGNELWLKVEKVVEDRKLPGIWLEFGEAYSDTGKYFEAICRDGHIIRMDDTYPVNRQKHTLIFELHNLLIDAKFCELEEKMKRGEFPTAEAFAKECERVEYESAINTEAIVAKAKLLKGDSWIYSYGSIFNLTKRFGFEFDYKFLLPDAHKEHYREHWREFHKIERPKKPIFNKIAIVAAAGMIMAGLYLKNTIMKVNPI